MKTDNRAKLFAGLLIFFIGCDDAAPQSKSQSSHGQKAIVAEKDPEELRGLAAIERLPEEGVEKTIVRDEKVPGRPVIKIALAGQAVTDSVIADLKCFRHLKSLSLQATSISEDGLKQLSSLSELETLAITWIGISDGAVRFLKPLQNLRELSLEATSVTSQGVMELSALTNLKTLYLTRGEIYDEAVDKLEKALPGLVVERGNDNTAKKRIRKFFSIPDKKPIDSATIEQAILAQIPLGSTEQQIVSALKKCGIEKDELSSIHALSQENEIVCRIEFDPASGYIVHTHYCLVFHLDSKQTLTEIEVKVWYTGP